MPRNPGDLIAYSRDVSHHPEAQKDIAIGDAGGKRLPKSPKAFVQPGRRMRLASYPSQVLEDDQVDLPSSSGAAVAAIDRSESGCRSRSRATDRPSYSRRRTAPARDRRSSDRCRSIGDIEPFRSGSDGKPMGLAGPIGKDHRIEPIFSVARMCLHDPARLRRRG